jgi:uncharacterized protein (DUF885 family)
MTIDRRQLLLATLAAGLAGAAPGLATAAPVDNPRFKALLDTFVEEILLANPEGATSLGLDKGPRAGLKRRLADVSIEGRRREVQGYADRARRLRALGSGGLSPRDLTLYETVLYAMDMGAEGGRFAYGGDGATPYVVSQQDGTVANTGEFLNSQHLIENAQDAEAYLARLEAYAVKVDQENARMADAAAHGVVPPDFILATALGQVSELRSQAPAEARLVTSLVERTNAKGLAGDWGGRASAIVSGKVFPALERQIAALKALQPEATHDGGVWKFRDGADYYRWALKEGTTTSLTASEIHQMGLDQGAAIDAQMDQVLKAQGYTTGTVGERMSALTADPRFLYPDTPQGRADLVAYLNGRITAIRAYLPKISRLGLAAPVQVKPVPKEIEAGAALGYMNFASLDGSRPAIYYVNLHDMRNWPNYTLASLTMHEALPGHAWQGAYLAERHDDIHTIASMMGFNAFVEGWALYAEQLADEAGLYADDPMGRLGYLQAQRFRAARLVVDTGLHDKRWGREHAIDWMIAATGRSRPAITSEVDRYCASPGQACGYKIGHTEIVRLREKARAALGPRFDLRDFNDAVVTTGGAPLSVLEKVMDRYIAGSRKA